MFSRKQCHLIFRNLGLALPTDGSTEYLTVLLRAGLGQVYKQILGIYIMPQASPVVTKAPRARFQQRKNTKPQVSALMTKMRLEIFSCMVCRVALNQRKNMIIPDDVEPLAPVIR